MYEPNSPRLAIIHKFLVHGAETERRMPRVIPHRGMITVWPDVAAERNVDFRPSETRVTICAATNRQITDHARAEELINLLDTDSRFLVRKVVKSCLFRKVPPWKKLGDEIYKVHPLTVKRRYEKALFDIDCADVSRTSRLAKCTYRGVKS